MTLLSGYTGAFFGGLATLVFAFTIAEGNIKKAFGGFKLLGIEVVELMFRIVFLCSATVYLLILISSKLS